MPPLRSKKPQDIGSRSKQYLGAERLTQVHFDDCTAEPLSGGLKDCVSSTVDPRPKASSAVSSNLGLAFAGQHTPAPDRHVASVQGGSRHCHRKGTLVSTSKGPEKPELRKLGQTAGSEHVGGSLVSRV